jgi:acyl-[acyl-carrier protein] desaturase
MSIELSGLSEVERAEVGLLVELEPEVGKLIDRHFAVAKEWFPHDYVPYQRGRDFVAEPWAPEHAQISPVAQTAFEVNLLTEDNLPSYHRLISAMFEKGDGAWRTWIHQWTAEEGRHAIVIRDYLMVTRNIDPVRLERQRMKTMARGYDRPTGAIRGLAYTALQELATRVSHINTGKLAGDPIAEKVMTRVAADENLHAVFYRDALALALELQPSAVIKAITAEVVGFRMPGAGIAGFARKAAVIAKAGIYDLRIHHDEIVVPLLRFWKVFDRTGLDADAERARDELAVFLGKLDHAAGQATERRAAAAAS